MHREIDRQKARSIDRSTVGSELSGVYIYRWPAMRWMSTARGSGHAATRGSGGTTCASRYIPLSMASQLAWYPARHRMRNVALHRWPRCIV